MVYIWCFIIFCQVNKGYSLIIYFELHIMKDVPWLSQWVILKKLIIEWELSWVVKTLAMWVTRNKPTSWIPAVFWWYFKIMLFIYLFFLPVRFPIDNSFEVLDQHYIHCFIIGILSSFPHPSCPRICLSQPPCFCC